MVNTQVDWLVGCRHYCVTDSYVVQHCLIRWSKPGLLTILFKRIAYIRYWYWLQKYRRYHFRYSDLKILWIPISILLWLRLRLNLARYQASITLHYITKVSSILSMSIFDINNPGQNIGWHAGGVQALLCHGFITGFVVIVLLVLSRRIQEHYDKLNSAL